MSAMWSASSRTQTSTSSRRHRALDQVQQPPRVATTRSAPRSRPGDLRPMATPAVDGHRLDADGVARGPGAWTWTASSGSAPGPARAAPGCARCAGGPISIGRPKASVLPEPALARPSTSCPASVSVRVAAWIGRAVRMSRRSGHDQGRGEAQLGKGATGWQGGDGWGCRQLERHSVGALGAVVWVECQPAPGRGAARRGVAGDEGVEGDPQAAPDVEATQVGGLPALREVVEQAGGGNRGLGCQPFDQPVHHHVGEPFDLGIDGPPPAGRAASWACHRGGPYWVNSSRRLLQGHACRRRPGSVHAVTGRGGWSPGRRGMVPVGLGPAGELEPFSARAGLTDRSTSSPPCGGSGADTSCTSTFAESTRASLSGSSGRRGGPGRPGSSGIARADRRCRCRCRRAR